MPRGQKTSNEIVYKVMLSVFSTGNYSETARQLNIPVGTVEDIYKRNIDKEEFTKLRKEKNDEFIENASRIINKATQLLERRLDTALESQNELDKIIDQVFEIDEKDMNEKKKKAIITKIERIQLYNLSEITTALGTVYDKRNLAEGKSTVNTDINVRMDKKVEELSQ